MNRLTKWANRTFYPNLKSHWSDIRLRDMVVERLGPDSRLLDLGAGRGSRSLLDYRSHCAFVAGVDPDEAVFENAYLHEARLQEPPGYAIPYPDSEFDVIVTNNVVEHVGDADFFFEEARRVLKPGGYLIARTPNKHHYIALIGGLTPHRFHVWYNGRRGRPHEDTFPTTYPCNTPGDVKRVSERSGFVLSRLDLVEGRPGYLSLSFPTFMVGVAYERVVNSSKLFEGLRAVMFFELRKG